MSDTGNTSRDLFEAGTRPAIRPRVTRPTGGLSPLQGGLGMWPTPEFQRANTRDTTTSPSMDGYGFDSWNLHYDPMSGPQPATPGQVDNWIRTNYPFMASFLSHPEVGPILRKAALEGWDEGRLYGAVQATDWWRSTSDNARMWEALVAEDPATASARAAQTAANLQNRARSLGLNISSGAISSLALTATKHGWTDNQVVDELLRNLNWATVQGGDLTALRDTVKAIGATYLVNVSEATAQNYAAAIASGEMSESGVASIMQRQARGQFSWMADEIDQGITPSEMLMPLRDVIAQELAMAPEAVNMMDPKWLGMLEVTGEDGQKRAATRDEARLSARKDPRWRDTSRAKEMMVQAGSAMRDVFGRRPI